MSSITLPVFCFRNITDPGQHELGILHYVGKVTAKDTLKLPTYDNLREYLAEYDPKKKTRVHRDIEATLRNSPELFSTYHSGMAICAAEIDKKHTNDKQLTLLQASIINGAQTRGVIGDTLNDDDEEEAGLLFSSPSLSPDAYVTFQLFICSEAEILAETAIAHNNQNQVKELSIANKRGFFKDLVKKVPELRLKESDQQGDDVIETEKLLQVLIALTPLELWDRKKEPLSRRSSLMVPFKNYAYAAKRRCLNEFEEVFKKRTDPAVKPEEREQANRLYQFYLDVAADAWKLYKKWKKHPFFEKSRIKCLVRENKHSGPLVEVPDGLIFPILAALSKCCIQKKGHWKLLPASEALEEALVDIILHYHANNARSRAHAVGSSMTAYTSTALTASHFPILNH